jgi:hypothetical protein
MTAPDRGIEVMTVSARKEDIELGAVPPQELSVIAAASAMMTIPVVWRCRFFIVSPGLVMRKEATGGTDGPAGSTAD